MKRDKKIIIIFILLISLFFNKGTILAESRDYEEQEALAVALVIDNSSSMASNDPEKLREKAANIFIDLLNSQDYVSLVTFHDSAQVILPMEKLMNKEDKDRIKEVLRENIHEGGYTDYSGALRVAKEQLDTIKNNKIKKVVVFLTDGEPMPNGEGENNPQYMENYMESLWQEVSTMGLNKYNIYPVGLSEEMNSKTLEKMAELTQGQVNISKNSGELARIFFEILGDLKNKPQLFNEEIDIHEKYTKDFKLNSYTSQCTMVITKDDQGEEAFSLEVIPPKGLEDNVIIDLSESDKYKIVTISKKQDNLQGHWKVNLYGQGRFNIFANEDFELKSWVKHPVMASLQPSKEPMEIEVEISGAYDEELEVEARILRDGDMDDELVKLTLRDGIYKGAYKGFNKAGEYTIVVTSKLDGEVISTTTSSFKVRDLPVITTDLLQDDKVYRKGDIIDFSASLRMDDGTVLQNTDLTVENYNLILEYENEDTVETIPLYHNGMADGSWKEKIKLSKEGSCVPFLRVNGTYNGESFLIEKSLKPFQVFPSGSVFVEIGKKKIEANDREKVKIPIFFESTSNFKETLVITMDEEEGILSNNIIQVNPKEVGTRNIYVSIPRKEKNYYLNLGISCEREDVSLNTNELNIRIEIMSIGDRIKGVLSNRDIIFFTGICVLGIPLLIIGIGLLFYRGIVVKSARIKGQLLYWREEEFLLEEKWKFDFSKNKKSKIIISFNEENKKADFYITNERYNYDIEISFLYEKYKWKFIHGYKALVNPSYRIGELMVKASEPGIIIKDGKGFTRSKLYKGDIFYSGDFVFQYRVKESKNFKALEKGINLLSVNRKT